MMHVVRLVCTWSKARSASWASCCRFFTAEQVLMRRTIAGEQSRGSWLRRAFSLSSSNRAWYGLEDQTTYHTVEIKSIFQSTNWPIRWNKNDLCIFYSGMKLRSRWWSHLYCSRYEETIGGSMGPQKMWFSQTLKYKVYCTRVLELTKVILSYKVKLNVIG